jgi:hypothetical protein
MATTAGAIRDAMIELVRDITPAKHATQKFNPYREMSDFRTWATATPAQCLRRYSIRNLNDRGAPAVTTGSVEEVSETFEVVVAYPMDGRHGSKFLTGLDDAISSDINQIHHVLHVANSPSGATVLRLTDDREIDEQAGVVFAVIRYRVDYYWSLT